MSIKHDRVVCWFSCGSTSAVATKLTLEKYPDAEIVYCDTGAEHEDNERFLKDCEDWFGKKVQILKNEKYDDIWAVFEKERYLVGVNGARCTAELKKIPRKKYQQVDDLQIFGFDLTEQNRADRFDGNNPECITYYPLIEAKLTKNDCINLLMEAGIELPAMYKLGYKNNNCIGCVKGQGGYWNKIRVDFPKVFDRMAKIERKLNAAICKTYAGDGKRKRLFLDELPEDFGNYKDLEIQCGLFCGEY